MYYYLMLLISFIKCVIRWAFILMVVLFFLFGKLPLARGKGWVGPSASGTRAPPGRFAQLKMCLDGREVTDEVDLVMVA
jgi:hypothetical protein